MHNIYDAKEHIDFDKIKSLLEKYKKKEIICFGGGSAANILMKSLLYQYSVTAFLDNNEKLWGEKLEGIEIMNPAVLKEKKRGTFVVLILSKHVTAITEQLEGYELESEVDFYNIYDEFQEYFRIMKFDDTAQKFLDFLETIPSGEFENITYQEKPVIGVVCVAAMVKVSVWYAMAQCLLLRKKGYRAVCIVDSLKGFDNYIYFEDYHNVVMQYIEYVLPYVKEKCPDFEVRYIRSENKVVLDEDDKQQLSLMTDNVLKWFFSRKDEKFLPDEPNRREIALGILETNLKSIRHHFEQYSYDTINVFTGMHKHRCLYWWISQRYEMRISTYDGNYGSDYMLYSSVGISAHSRDLQKVFTDNYLTAAEKERLYEWAKETFQKRISLTTDSDECAVFQPVGMDAEQKQYDIIMPLNVEWDAAALGLDKLFADSIEWIKETVHYIMKETDATVMIREHPHNKILADFNYFDYSELLKELEQYGDRVYLCTWRDKVNTYQSILQSKLVLPYTSTIGLEAVMLGKKILVHTDCYYANFSFASPSETKEEYLRKVKFYYENEYEPSEEEKKEAALLFALQMNTLLYTDFTEAKTGWMENGWTELFKIKRLESIIEAITEGKPVVLNNLNELFND